LITAIGLWYLTVTAPIAGMVIPNFEVKRQCEQTIGSAGDVSDVQACIRGERAARAALDRQWTQFSTVERAYCVQLSDLAKMGTYTELLICLEVSRDAQRIRARERRHG